MQKSALQGLQELGSWKHSSITGFLMAAGSCFWQNFLILFLIHLTFLFSALGILVEKILEKKVTVLRQP